MPWLTNLADIARRTGCKVVEVSGWKKRGHGPQAAVQGVVCHHTAGWRDLHVVRDGRPGLDGPLSHFWLSRDGVIHVVAAGRCWHNAPSTSPHHMNSTSLGIEAENDGATPWPAVQLDAYKKLCAELCRAFKLPASRVKGHKEVNTSKIDPHSISMKAFRADVGKLLKGKPVEAAKPKPAPKPGKPPTFKRPLKLTMPLMEGDDVRQWQAQARRFVPSLKADGWYGPISKKACITVQKAVGVPANGVVSAETWLLTWIWEKG